MIRILVACLTLAGCVTVDLPVNTCGEAPKRLGRELEGREYVARAQAWEVYARCLESLTKPDDELPTVQPDMRPIPKPNPWDAASRDLDDRRQWALPSRRARLASTR